MKFIEFNAKQWKNGWNWNGSRGFDSWLWWSVQYSAASHDPDARFWFQSNVHRPWLYRIMHPTQGWPSMHWTIQSAPWSIVQNSSTTFHCWSISLFFFVVKPHFSFKWKSISCTFGHAENSWWLHCQIKTNHGPLHCSCHLQISIKSKHPKSWSNFSTNFSPMSSI